jgi:hypothetical protein
MAQTEREAFSATSSQIRTIRPVFVFYDISRAGMHLGELEKRQVWPYGDMRSSGNVTGAEQFAIRPGGDIIGLQENYCSFLDIYGRARRFAAWPGGEISLACRQV